jgi:chromosome partitioning protein
LQTRVEAGLGWPGSPEQAESGLGWPERPSGPVSQSRAPTTPPTADLRPDTVHVPTAAEIAVGDSLGDISALPLARAAERSVRQAAHEASNRLRRPQKTRLMVVANQKGGVGKTTTAVNVAAALAAGGLRILVVDLDPQGNASTALSVPHAEGTPGTYDVLTGELSLDEVTVESSLSGVAVVPATIDLAGAEIELVTLERRESRLRDALRGSVLSAEGSESRFDFVMVDCPPSLGLLTLNALAAGDELLVPIQCEYYALEGLSQLLRTIDSVREHVNPSLRLGSILLTMYDGRTRLATGVADEVRNHFGDLVLRTTIPRSVRISEAPSYGQTVLTYDPDSLGARAYRAVAVELTEREETT